MSLSLK